MVLGLALFAIAPFGVSNKTPDLSIDLNAEDEYEYGVGCRTFQTERALEQHQQDQGITRSIKLYSKCVLASV